METPVHALVDLFRQLGVADDGPGVEQFIATHRPLADAVTLADAPFWTPAQRQFLREQLCADADWAEVVDVLDACLRG